MYKLRECNSMYIEMSRTLALFFCNDVIDWKKEPFFFFNLEASIRNMNYCADRNNCSHCVARSSCWLACNDHVDAPDADAQNEDVHIVHRQGDSERREEEEIRREDERGKMQEYVE